MKLRLYHHPDGARVAYREQGTGPAVILWHSELLSHRELTPLVEGLEHRHRVVLPDLPLHGDSEDRPRHPYTRGLAGRGRRAASARTSAGRGRSSAGTGSARELVLRAVEQRRHAPVAADPHVRPGCTARRARTARGSAGAASRGSARRPAWTAR